MKITIIDIVNNKKLFSIEYRDFFILWENRDLFVESILKESCDKLVRGNPMECRSYDDNKNKFFYAGVPDYLCIKNGDRVWVEIKYNKDSLHKTQLEWMIDNKEETIVVMFIEGLEHSFDDNPDTSSVSEYISGLFDTGGSL